MRRKLKSQPPVQQLFLFNRATFYAESPETWAVSYEEGLTLPPLLNRTSHPSPRLMIVSAISDLSQAQRPFILASDHLQHLQSLFYAQARALSIAYTSLASHLDPLIREFEEFQDRAKGHLDNEDRLLRSSQADMVILPRIIIHDAFNKKKEKEGAEVLTMASLVNPVKMQKVRETCQEAHGMFTLGVGGSYIATHIKQFDKLARQIGDLAIQSEAERRASEDRSQQVAAEFEQGIQRFELAISQLEHLFQTDAPSLSQGRSISRTS
jgi:autophagy-related protein 11